MAEDAPLELAESRPGLEAELLDETVATGPVGGKSVGLATAAIQRDDELCEQAFARGVLRDERFERFHQSRPLSALELGVEMLLESCDAKVLQLPRLRGERREVRQRGTTPECKRVAMTTLLGQLPKPLCIDGNVRGERIARPDQSDRVGAEPLPQARDVRLHDLPRGGRRGLLPQRAIDRGQIDGRANPESEQREQRPLLRRPGVDRLAVDQHLERTQDRHDDRHSSLSAAVDHTSTAVCDISGMTSSHTRGLCAALAALAAAGVALAATGGAAGSASTVLKASLTGRYLHTTSKGRGTATITFTATQACWKFSYSGLDLVNISGIHVVPPPPGGYHKLSVLPFTATTSQKPGCEKLDRWGASGPGWAKKIVANPSHFYVIIGTGRYPNGAIGGVLHGA